MGEKLTDFGEEMKELLTDFGEEMKELIKKGVEEAFEKAMEAVRKSLAEWAMESRSTSHLPNEDKGEESDKVEESTHSKETYSDGTKLLPEMPALQVLDENTERRFIKKAPSSISQGTNPIICPPNPYCNALKTHCKMVRIYKLHENEYGKVSGMSDVGGGYVDLGNGIGLGRSCQIGMGFGVGYMASGSGGGPGGSYGGQGGIDDNEEVGENESVHYPTDAWLPSQSLNKGKQLVSSLTKGGFATGYYNFYLDSDNVLRLLYDGPEITSFYWPNFAINISQNCRTNYNSSRIGILNDMGRFLASDHFQFSASDAGAKDVEQSFLPMSTPAKAAVFESFARQKVSEAETNVTPSIKQFIKMSYGFVTYSNSEIMYADCPRALFTKLVLCYMEEGGTLCFPSDSDGNNVSAAKFLNARITTIPTSFEGGFKLTEKQLTSVLETVSKPWMYVSGPTINPTDLLYINEEIQSILSVWAKFGARVIPDTSFLGPEFTSKPHGSWNLGTSIAKSSFCVSLLGGVFLKMLTGGLTFWFLVLNPPYLVDVFNCLSGISKPHSTTRFTAKKLLSLKEQKAGDLICSINGGVKMDRFSSQQIQLLETKEHSDPYAMLQKFQALKNLDPQEFPYIPIESVQEATNNFSDSNKLGQGGFGPVYKGTLPTGENIAVKRLSATSTQGSDEFINEVLLIFKLQHKNLVRLLGFCVDREERILIYEYMSNSSLDLFLNDESKRAKVSWTVRLDIINGIARGMLYLPQDSRLRIIHRDLKPSNVLLDEEMNPKISDFGMARILGGSEFQASSTVKIVGTYGYIAPEFSMEGLYSTKSDVFSFGVLLLEIISGKRNAEFHLSTRTTSLLSYAWRLWNEGNGAVNSVTILGTVPLHLGFGMSLHCLNVKCGLDGDMSVGSCLLTMYVRCGSVCRGRKFFDDMPGKGLITWDAMISGYAQNGHASLVLDLYREMELKGVFPDPVTFVAVLSSCANLGAAKVGSEVEQKIKHRGFGYNWFLQNVLINMYARCGNLVRAHTIFSDMLEKILVSRTSIIGGYGIHRHGENAVQLFDQMIDTGIHPEETIFVSILSACSHAGLTDRGLKYFDLMKKKYRLQPGSEHYSCVVDLLGRAGRLKEARQLIESMYDKPDGAVWGALLGAFMIRRDEELVGF